MENFPQPWLRAAIDAIASRPCCGYHRGAAPDAEPTALAALALLAHGRAPAAGVALQWLRDAQQSDGRVATADDAGAPGWPTALAVWAWNSAPADQTSAWQSALTRGVQWLLESRGVPEPNHQQMGHDMTLVGWSWVEQTHSWIEPTSMAVLALKAVGKSEHPRVHEAVRMLWDRQLPSGGFNYGNTRVLGQMLRAHLLPTGLALAALADEPNATRKLHRSCDYLEGALGPRTPAASLAWGVMGLDACQRRPANADDWLAAAFSRLNERGAPSPWPTALLCRAAATQAAALGAAT